MIFERESCTAVQMEIAGICAELRQVRSLFCIEQTFRQADTPPKFIWATFSHGEMGRSNKLYFE
jgi:hypothetical protein